MDDDDYSTSITSLKSGDFNQLSGRKMGDIDMPAYNPDDVFEEIEGDREQAELAQMMDMIDDYGRGNYNGEPSFADSVLDNSQGFKIFSSIFMDIKDPLIMLLISQLFFGKAGRRIFRDKADFLHDPETGVISYTGMAARFALIFLIFFVVRRMLNSYFTG